MYSIEVLINKVSAPSNILKIKLNLDVEEISRNGIGEEMALYQDFISFSIIKGIFITL